MSSDQKQPDRRARKPVFFRPPDNWEEMTEQEQDVWLEDVATRIWEAREVEPKQLD